MKKQSLLGAAALSTVAFAGVANAQSLVPAANAGATVGEYRVIATESKLSAAQRTGVIGLEYTVGAGTPGALSKLTVALSGGATFSGAFNITQLNTGTPCDPTITLSTGGAKGDSAATFLVEGLNNCVADELAFNVPVLLATGTTGVNVATSLTTELGTPIAAGTTTTQITGSPNTDLISFGKAVDITVAADTDPTQATIASDFKLLATGFGFDNEIGEAVVTVDTTRFLGINSAATIAATNFSGVSFDVVGDLENLDVDVNGTAVVEGSATPGEGTATITPAASGTYTVSVTEAGSDPIPGGAYQMRVRLTAGSTALVNPVATGLVPLQTVTREGAQYLIPWVASRTLAQTSTSNTVIRIANIGSSAVGRVSAELVTSSTGVTSTTLVPLATSISPRGEVVITSNSLQNAFGADFGRGDIRLTVEGAPANLVVRRFVQSTVNGALSEVSLGRSSFGGDTGAEPIN
jgi:hypothetical protein